MKEHEESDKWALLVADLQREIDQKEQADYSATVLMQARNPTNLGRMDAPDAHAVIAGPCGDTMEIDLRLDGDVIQDARFMTDGCGTSVASGNMLTTMVRGMTLDNADRVSPRDLLLALDGLPDESTHCAHLAVNTLRKAIEVARRAGSQGDA
ncbi:MAG TPA: iron-sulfur cluster assembly scaffold protein [Anaerolineae bacterium]|nr:iron-sulfur cluster assembly scaffold protein [Anaerolineae bacterium]